MGEDETKTADAATAEDQTRQLGRVERLRLHGRVLLGRTLRDLFQPLLGRLPVSPPLVGGIAAGGILALGLALLATGVFGGGSHRTLAGEPGSLIFTNTSWIPGQPSLAESPGFVALAARFQPLAAQRDQERRRMLALIEARKKAAQARARALARKRYEEARRRALAKYRRELRQHALLVAKIKRENARRKRQHAQQVAAYLKKKRAYELALQVQPGSECKLPEVQAHFRCQTGRLPTPPAKHSKRRSKPHG